MLILLIFLFIVIFDNVIMFLYCSIKEKRDVKNLNTNVEVNQVVNEYDDKLESNNGLFKLQKNILLWCESFLRLNILILSKIPSHRIRKFILRKVYRMKIDKNVVIYGGFEIRSPWNIIIGKGSIIGDKSILDGRYGINIGENVNLSTGVWIWTNQHNVNDINFSDKGEGGKVIIENRAWISARTIILPKVRINEGCVVAAGAVVTKDCDEFSIYGGIPAKKIGKRNKDLSYEFDGKHLHFL